MRCPDCGQENPEGFRFCGACGSELVLAPASTREERKVVTVLFADLVGFTSRAEQLDPEDVRALLQPYHARLRLELERFGGTVEKFIGDAVMALFGAPVAHEDDPERAVRAALAIRDWVSEEGTLDVRLAANTGEALIALDARPERGEGMASGDVVNTTARLQAAAPVNGILVGETTYRATRGVIDYRTLQPVEAKGKGAPVPVWEALSPRSQLGVDVVRPGRTALVGRDRELQLLLDTLERVHEERAPQLVTLVGVPGIGKSRLIFELLRAVEGRTEPWLWRQGRCLAYGEGVTFWALGEIVKSHATIFETDADDKTAEKLGRAVAAAVSDPAEAAWIEAHLRPLVGLPPVDAPAADREMEEFAAWRRFLEALAEQCPLVVVIEDLHWVDDNLLDFVDHLVDWASEVPMLVICTARPELLERRPGWGGGKANATTLTLSPLSDEDTTRLFAALFERAVLSVETQQTLLIHTGGNPLYAEEYVSMLMDQRGSTDELPLPETVQGLIAARLDGLASAEKSLLHDAAVHGQVFWTGALATMGDGSRFDVEKRLHALERKEFVRRERRSSVGGETEYAFRHLLVRDVAYGQIPRAARVEKHRRAADWIDSLGGRRDDYVELLADHCSQALELARAIGLPTAELETRARVALRDAGERAAALGAFASACRYYDRALPLWPPDVGDRPRLLLGYGKALRMAESGGEELLSEARDALLESGDVESGAEAEAVLGELLWEQGRTGPAAEHLGRAVGLLRHRPASSAKVQALTSLSRLNAFTGKAAEAVELGREAARLAEDLGLDELQAHALDNVGTARVHLGDPGGVEDLECALELALAARSIEALRVYNNLGGVLAGRGDVSRARELRVAATELARKLGNRYWLDVLHTGEAGDALITGRWDDTLRLLDELDEPIEAPILRGIVRLGRGDLEGAVEDGSRGVEAARATGRPDNVAASLALYVWALHAAGLASEARRAADELLAVLPKDPLAILAEPTVMIALVALGLGHAALAAVAGLEAPTIVEAAKLCAAGDFETAADTYAKLGCDFPAAWARLRAAESLLEAGRRGEADQQLGQALAFFRSAGATAFIREGEALLAAAS
jgi:class 3 adenylate cyclase/tetratricopeptide (TPR) repeat protein